MPAGAAAAAASDVVSGLFLSARDVCNVKQTSTTQHLLMFPYPIEEENLRLKLKLHFRFCYPFIDRSFLFCDFDTFGLFARISRV